MALPQIIAVFHALFNVIGLPGNLLVILTIVLERRFHVMRYILLASLAVSDFLCLILVNSFRIASIAKERWLYGQTMCLLNAFFARYFFLNSVLHLIAVSYERYSAVVKSPLTYDGTITKSRVVLMALIWIVPIPICISPFLGWGKYVYNPDMFFCEQGWSEQSGAIAATLKSMFFFVVPFLVIAFLNWRVFKAVKTLQRNDVAPVQVENTAAPENHSGQEISRGIRERKAAVDVSIVIAAFLFCCISGWIAGLCRQFITSFKVSAEVILVTACIFMSSFLCNPIIYSIRKRGFRMGVKNVFRRIGICGSSNEIDVACHKQS
ncbi:octopamine receptor beta-1R-like [Orbicella faveolata]|uniref:octopamine receptor beta-1R-like n=1 Tax=Orbicella faveolata TaxID=48498 RepID=UPI0009E2B4BA|nr:octopamine receptor beta-1R-like [Orbicella faveolata]